MRADRTPLSWRWCRFDELSVFELDAIYLSGAPAGLLEDGIPHTEMLLKPSA